MNVPFDVWHLLTKPGDYRDDSEPGVVILRRKDGVEYMRMNRHDWDEVAAKAREHT